MSALRVSAATYSRWASGENNPGRQLILQLAELYSELAPSLQEEFPDEFSVEREEPTNLFIPRSYLQDVIQDLGTVAEYLSHYALSNKVFEQIISQLDPRGDGLLILPSLCRPGDDGRITFLRTTDGYGTGIWKFQLARCCVEVGRESLVGAAVTRMRPVFYPHQHALASTANVFHLEDIQSAGAFPILRRGKVAGALIIASVHADFFNQARRDLSEIYSYMYALSLFDHQFYSPDHVQLHTMPERVEVFMEEKEGETSRDVK